MGHQNLTLDRYGLRLASANKKHVIVALDDAEFELQPRVARSVALAILNLCNELEK